MVLGILRLLCFVHSNKSKLAIKIVQLLTKRGSHVYKQRLKI